MPKQDRATMESELKRLEMEEELARLEAEEATDQQAKAEPTGLEKIETAGRSLLEGVTAGVSEPAISGVNAVLGNLIDAGFDSENLKDFFSKSIDTAKIAKEYEKEVDRRSKLEAQLPGISMASEIGGAMLPISAPAKIAKGAGIALKGLEKVPAIGSILRGAAEAAAGGFGSEAVKQAAQIPTGVMPKEQAPALGEVAETGAKIGAALGTLPVIGKAAAYAAPRVMSAFGGVSPKIISDYLKREAPIAPVSSDKLKEAVEIAAQNVQDALSTQKSLTADDLVTAVQALKEKVINASNEAFQILESAASGKKAISVPFATVAGSINKSLNELRAGSKALTPVREAAASYLDDLLERFQSRAVKGKIDLVTAKEMIQAIDEIKNYSKEAGTFSSSLDRALGSLRSAIDEPLKAIPEYSAKMKEVSSAASLLSMANDYFGDAERAFKNVDRLVIGKDPFIAQAAKRLEDLTGIKINRGIESLRDLRPVQNILPDTAEVFVNQVLTGRSPIAAKRLSILSQMADENLVELANQAILTKEFGKLVQNGSRDVNFWKEVLGSSSQLALGGGVLGGPLGAMTGATVGYLVKSYGAPVTKKILDGMIKVRGIPTVQKINQALSTVTPEVRQSLVQGFVKANVLRMDPAEPEMMTIDPSQTQNVYQEIKDSKLDALTKAKALESLSKRGEIETKTMKKFMVGAQAPVQNQVKPSSKEALEADKPSALIRR